MGTEPINALPVAYYKNLLTSEYKLSTKFNMWLVANLSILEDITDLLQAIYTYFDLDTAVGDQLDTVGAIVGAARQVSFQPTSGSPILDDTTYRLLIKATIANNQWDGKIDSLYPIWGSLFPGGTIIIEDHQDMTATIIVTGSFSSIVQDLISHDLIVPRPETVQYNYSFGSLPFFGFSVTNTAFIAGFNVGNWS